MKHPLHFNFAFFRDCYRLMKPYWTLPSQKKAYLYLCICLSLFTINVFTSIAMNDFSKNFYNALQDYNTQAIPGLMLHFSYLVFLYSASSAIGFLVMGHWNLHWRRWMTEHFLERWLDTHHKKKFREASKDCDNPDQRLSDDIALFISLSLDVLSTLYKSGLTFLLFGIVLWHLSGILHWQIGSWHFAIGGYLFLAALVYALLGTWANAFLGRKLSMIQYEQQKYNANFRYALMRLREPQSTDLSPKKEGFYEHLKEVFQNYAKGVHVQTRLLLFSGTYHSLAFIFGLLIAIPKYLKKETQLGGLLQISGAFSSVITSASVIINTYGELAEWRSVTHRLKEFQDLLEGLEEKEIFIEIENVAAQEI